MPGNPPRKRPLFLLPLLLFATLTVTMFSEGWSQGMVIQGIDGTYSQMRLDQMNILDGRSGIWDPSHWLGTGRMLDVNFYFLCLRLFPESLVAMGGYSITILLTQVFMWLLLLRLNLGMLAATFGAVAYGFAPHFVTLIFPGHVFAVYGSAFAAMLFFFLTVALDGKARGWRAWVCVPAAGFGWGMLMNSDVQRGLYYSVTAIAYACVLIWSNTTPRPWSWRVLISPPMRSGIARLLLIGAVALSIFAHNANLQFGSENVSGRVSGVTQEGAQAESEKWAFATSWSMYPAELLDSLAPGFHGMITGDPDRPYWGRRPAAHSNDGLGYFVLIFGLAGIWIAFRRSTQVRFFAAAALLATLLAFGEYWPGRPLFNLWYRLPMMDKMRAPVKFMCVTAFCLSVLSAFGIQGLLNTLRENSRTGLRRWVVSFAALSGVALVGLILVIAGAFDIPSGAPSHGAVTAMLWMLAYSLLAVALLGAAWIKWRFCLGSRIVGGALLMLLVVNLFQINRFYIQRSWFKPSEFYRQDPIVQYLQQNIGQGRVACSLKVIHQGRMIPLSLMGARNMYVTHIFKYFGIEAMEHTPQPRIATDYDAYFKVLLPPIPQVGSADAFVRILLDGQIRFWQLSSVNYVVTDGYLHGVGPQPIPAFEVMKKHPALQLSYTGNGFGGQPMAVFEVKHATPLFSLCTKVAACPSPESALRRLADHGYDFHATALLARGQDNHALPANDAAGNGNVKVKSIGPGDVQLICETSIPAILRWTSRFDAGWKATINGEPASLLPVDFIMTGLELDAGTSVIRLQYAPESKLWWLSLGVAITAFLFVVAGLLININTQEKRGRSEKCR